MTSQPNDDEYKAPGPARAEIDALPGAVVVDFGTNWCGHCQAARAPIASAFSDFPDIAHLRIEDGKGRFAGRSFDVRLWPTLIFLADGREIARVVRPTDPRVVTAALAELAVATQGEN